MPERDLPVRPDLEQLRHQAKDLLRDAHAHDATAIADFTQFHPELADPTTAQLADAQLVLARSYGASSWPRLVTACRLIDAIWDDDVATVRALALANTHLLDESTLLRSRNWGRPMSYAANLGRDEIIRALHDLGATDHVYAMGRAMLQSQIGTARLLHALAGKPRLPNDALSGSAYTLSASGTALAFELGARVVDENGRTIAPIDTVLETDSRKPAEKHAILEMYARHGAALPDTPPMAVHRGRIDLLEEHLRRDPSLLRRTFDHEEIFPPSLGCHNAVLATHGTPLDGATLLHMAVDYDEMEIARWLLDRGMNVDARAAVDLQGFGGHTALFATVVSQPNLWMNRQHRSPVAPFTQLLLDHGADPNARASLRKQLHPGYGEETMHEFRDITPLGWGQQFHRKIFVSEPAMKLIAERGGHA
ncbi:MAG TPA: ankyrin repeat domain-containing protein [Gemmatimonadaceae bacterium]